jgi:hypothetical protein
LGISRLIDWHIFVLLQAVEFRTGMSGDRYGIGGGDVEWLRRYSLQSLRNTCPFDRAFAKVEILAAETVA